MEEGEVAQHGRTQPGYFVGGQGREPPPPKGGSIPPPPAPPKKTVEQQFLAQTSPKSAPHLLEIQQK